MVIYWYVYIGSSPSGKALDFDSSICVREFESRRPNHRNLKIKDARYNAPIDLLFYTVTSYISAVQFLLFR